MRARDRPPPISINPVSFSNRNARGGALGLDTRDLERPSYKLTRIQFISIYESTCVRMHNFPHWVDDDRDESI